MAATSFTGPALVLAGSAPAEMFANLSFKIIG